MFMLSIVLANNCSDSLTIIHAMSLILSKHEKITTGVEFTLICEEGYSAFPGNGSLICDESGTFMDKPACKGN